jgi:glucose/mannose-6-phosphate isomerase
VVNLAIDDNAAIRKIDESGMLLLMQRSPNRLVPPADAESTCHIDIPRPTNIVLAGVGGSGIVGDILADYCRDAVQLPTAVCRSLKIPKYVDKSTLFVAISYSGETRETLHMFEQAKKAGAKLAIVTSGGKLLNAAQVDTIPYVQVAAGMLPRVSLPELVAAVTHILGQAKVIDGATKLLESGSRSMSALIDTVNAEIPLERNPAKQVAMALTGHLPLLIGSEQNVSVLRRFKNELNENSKVPAFFYTLPEAYHDDIEGLKELTHLSAPQPVILRSQDEHEGEELARERLLDTFSQLNFPLPLFFDGIGAARFEWLISAITFGDFVSFYLAVLREVDPSKLSLIPQFRAIKGRV